MQVLVDAPMPIFTPRLQIRPRQIGEGKIIAQAIRESFDHLNQFMPFCTDPPVDEKTEQHCVQSLEEFEARTNFNLSIYDLKGRTFIGSTGIHYPNWRVPSFQLGYWLHKDFEGQGFITESTNALTRYCFEVFKAKRVEIRCSAKNLRSLQVIQRLGFEIEGTLRNEDVHNDGTLMDTVITARLNTLGLPALQVRW